MPQTTALPLLSGARVSGFTPKPGYGLLANSLPLHVSITSLFNGYKSTSFTGLFWGLNESVQGKFLAQSLAKGTTLFPRKPPVLIIYITIVTSFLLRDTPSPQSIREAWKKSKDGRGMQANYDTSFTIIFSFSALMWMVTVPVEGKYFYK